MGKQSTYFSRYGLKFHGISKEDYMKSRQASVSIDGEVTSKIDKTILILNFLIITADKNRSKNDYIFNFTNKYLVDVFAEKHIKMSQDEVSVYLTRLAAADFLKITYNNELYCDNRVKPYPKDMYKNGDSIGVNKSIDTSTDYCRQITLNMDYILELASIIDFNDPTYYNLPIRSIARKFVKKRLITNYKGVRKNQQEKLARINATDTIVRKGTKYVKTINAAWRLFIKKVSTKYYNTDTKFKTIAIYTDKFKERMEALEKTLKSDEELCWDTGQVLPKGTLQAMREQDTIAKENQSKLDKFFKHGSKYSYDPMAGVERL